jgi:hypothetical protein
MTDKSGEHPYKKQKYTHPDRSDRTNVYEATLEGKGL